MKVSTIQNKYIFSLSTIILVITLWIILSSTVNNTYIFPTFSMLKDGLKIVLIDNFKVIVFTIVKIVLAITLSTLISSLIVLLYIWKKDLLGFFTPIISFIHVVPTMGISLYLYYFVDPEMIPFVLSTMVIVPIMVEGLKTAYDNIDKGLVDVLKLEQISFFKKVFKVYIPLMIPYILMTFLQSVSLGIKAMIMGEYLSNSNNSLGGMLYAYQTIAETNVIIVILVILFAISIICEIIIKIIQQKLKYTN